MGVRCGRDVLVGGYVGVAASAVIVAYTAADVCNVSGVGEGPGVGVNVIVGVGVGVLVIVGGTLGVDVGKTTTVCAPDVGPGPGCVVADDCWVGCEGVKDACTVGEGCTEVGAIVTGDCNGGTRPPQPALANASMNASDAKPLFV